MKTEEEAIEWVRMHIPLVVNSGGGKYPYTYPYKSTRVFEEVVIGIGKELFKLLNTPQGGGTE